MLDMAEIGVSHLMCHDRTELMVIGALQKSCGYQEVAAPGIASIDIRVLGNAHLHFVERDRVVHLFEQRNHDALEAGRQRRADLFL